MDYEFAYRYAAASRLDEGGGLELATSGGSTPEGEAAHPFFFSGFMERPDGGGRGSARGRARGPHAASTCRPAWFPPPVGD